MTPAEVRMVVNALWTSPASRVDWGLLEDLVRSTLRHAALGYVTAAEALLWIDQATAVVTGRGPSIPDEALPDIGVTERQARNAHVEIEKGWPS